MLNVEIAVTTVHGEATRVLARVKEPDLVEFWYAEILHGTIPLPWLNAWVTSLAPRSIARFAGVMLSTGPKGEVLVSIPPEVIDHPLTDDEVARLMGVRPEPG